MRLHILSDLHLELGSFEPPSVIADVTVLAGDTWTGARLTPWIDARKAFGGRRVVAVAGNHCFWGSTIDTGLSEMRERANEQHVDFLELNTLVIDGVRILGCTLWTDYRLHARNDDAMRNRDMGRCGAFINDFGKIRRTKPPYTSFDPAYAANLHQHSIAWLETALAIPFSGATVVVTHHAPSKRCLAPGLIADPAAPAYASNLDLLIERWRPDLWISGHTHHSVDFMIGETRVMSNPRGYVGRDMNKDFDPSFVIEV